MYHSAQAVKSGLSRLTAALRLDPFATRDARKEVSHMLRNPRFVFLALLAVAIAMMIAEGPVGPG